MTDVWPLVHAEREALIAFLDTLDHAHWNEPSLCAGWSLHDVVAHLVATAKATLPLNFLVGLAAARFDFDRENANGVARERGATPQETLARFRAVVNRTSSPPAPRDTRLVEAIVHGEDIRRPLGSTHEYPLAAVERALRLQVKTSTSFGGGKERVAGLTLIAEDADVSIGDGPAVKGPRRDPLSPCSLPCPGGLSP
ncbi:maleylpyruvate isomerase family mycothiol-dependent enzyme [Pseudonocardia nigra]|uniref:maleylpyruvate isomerase family mycothiol-dependent enzyme n=1 Tax=Pseudonocardia nigra TaxID=1921578 RepID=UPI001C5D06F0|nr:maleylpyruvate isomerase family mycothiol-dependent enzyme [Pseudonocardia nigra]